MFEFHKDKDRYFDIQCLVTEENIIPFIKEGYNLKAPKYILEIGCAEAGVLKAFLKEGHDVVGIELSESRYADANQNLAKYNADGRAQLINSDIYDINPKDVFDKPFDVIILKDVIEHIPDQSRFLDSLKSFLSDDGIIFFAYPPWWMPFGGHQQICTKPFLQRLPWFHLLPTLIYKKLLEVSGENELTIKELMQIKSTGINIESMLRLIQKNGYTVIKEKYWFINPIYKFKFGLNKKEVKFGFSKLPYIRNIYTTAHYIMFKK